MKNAIIWLIVGFVTASVALGAEKSWNEKYQKQGINKLMIDGKTCTEKTCEGDVIFLANPLPEYAAEIGVPYAWQQRQRFNLADLLVLVGRSCTLAGQPSGFTESIKSCEEVDKLAKLEEDKKKKSENKNKKEEDKQVKTKSTEPVKEVKTEPVKDKS